MKPNDLATIYLSDPKAGDGTPRTVRLVEPRPGGSWKWEAPTPEGVEAFGTRFGEGIVSADWIARA